MNRENEAPGTARIICQGRPTRSSQPGPGRGLPKTRRLITAGHSPEDQTSLPKQIADAEEQKKIQYSITMAGCYYEIEYGLLNGGGKGG
jgi:hypothetical protein